MSTPIDQMKTYPFHINITVKPLIYKPNIKTFSSMRVILDSTLYTNLQILSSLTFADYTSYIWN